MFTSLNRVRLVPLVGRFWARSLSAAALFRSLVMAASQRDTAPTIVVTNWPIRIKSGRRRSRQAWIARSKP